MLINTLIQDRQPGSVSICAPDLCVDVLDVAPAVASVPYYLQQVFNGKLGGQVLPYLVTSSITLEQLLHCHKHHAVFQHNVRELLVCGLLGSFGLGCFALFCGSSRNLGNHVGDEVIEGLTLELAVGVFSAH